MPVGAAGAASGPEHGEYRWQAGGSGSGSRAADELAQALPDNGLSFLMQPVDDQFLLGSGLRTSYDLARSAEAFWRQNGCLPTHVGQLVYWQLWQDPGILRFCNGLSLDQSISSKGMIASPKVT